MTIYAVNWGWSADSRVAIGNRVWKNVHTSWSLTQQTHDGVPRYMKYYPKMTVWPPSGWLTPEPIRSVDTGLAPTPDNWMWKEPYNMELDEAHIGNQTSRGTQVHSARVDLTSRLSTLAAAKASCSSRILAHPVACKLTDLSHSTTIFISPAFSLKGLPASQHTSQTWQVPGRTRFHASVMLRTEFGHLWPDWEERCSTCHLPPSDRRTELKVDFSPPIVAPLTISPNCLAIHKTGDS